jgi:transposase-like protein
MPTVTIRVSAEEKQQLVRDAHSRGVAVSELVRDALGVRSGDLAGRVEDLERRMSEIERMAGVQ